MSNPNDDEAMMMDNDDDNNQQKNPINNNNDDDIDGNEIGDTIVDEIPEFLNPNDAVEVQVDDDNVPMDDDDDDDDDANLDEEFDDSPQVADMSRIRVESHNGPVYALASYLDPLTQKLVIVSGGGDDKAYYHQLASDSISVQSTLLPYNHTDSVSSVALNLEYIPRDDPNASDITKYPRLIAVGAYDGAIILYNADNGELVKQLEGPTDVEWICFHPKGGTVLLAGSAADGTVWMYHMLDTMQYKCLQVFVGHESAVNAGNFSPDGKWALTASADGTVRIWAPRTGLCKHVFRFNTTTTSNNTGGLTTMSVNGGSDGQLLIVGAEDGYAHICHIGTKKVVASLRHYEPPATFSNSDDNDVIELPMSVEAVGFASSAFNPNWCATGGVDGVLKIWDLSIGTGQCRQICQQQQQQQQPEQSDNKTIKLGGITRLQWHPTLPIVITSYTSGIINLWDARNGQLVRTITGGSTEVVNDINLHFVDNGSKIIIISASDDNLIRFFDIDLTTLIV